MVEQKPIEARVSSAAESVAKEQGVEFVHAEILGSKRDSVVRIFIDKEAGVTIDDCTRFSASIEEILDTEDLIPWAYVLEVSSPGIERQLYSLKDFIKFTGELAKVKTTSEIGGQRNFAGRIESIDGMEIIFEDRTSGKVRIPFETVEKANLKIDLAKEFKGR